MRVEWVFGGGAPARLLLELLQLERAVGLGALLAPGTACSAGGRRREGGEHANGALPGSRLHSWGPPSRFCEGMGCWSACTRSGGRRLPDALSREHWGACNREAAAGLPGPGARSV